jgi:hypothetical protein
LQSIPKVKGAKPTNSKLTTSALYKANAFLKEEESILVTETHWWSCKFFHRWRCKLTIVGLTPGPNPTTSSYNANVANIYNATGSLARFES